MQTVIIETENSNQLDLLLRLAKELHLKTEVAESEKAEKIILSKMAETAFQVLNHITENIPLV